jgi:YD repeat-containing protein
VLRIWRIFFLTVAALMADTARAAENINYGYDSLGRVIRVTHVGGDNDGMVVSYNYDPAGNRTEFKVSGSKNLFPQGAKVIVLPLNGFTVVVIPN